MKTESQLLREIILRSNKEIDALQKTIIKMKKVMIEGTGLEALENKVLYTYFKKNNPDTLISYIAEEYLTKKEFEQYQVLQGE